MKLEPLSVVVLHTFWRMPYSVCCTYSRAAARTSKVCDPFSQRQARAADLRCRVAGSIRWTVTPRYERRRAVQQSVVVATADKRRIASQIAIFIVTTMSEQRRFNVARHITVRPGCRPATSARKEASSTVANGNKPSFMKLITRGRFHVAFLDAKNTFLALGTLS